MFDNISKSFWKIAIPLMIIMVGDQLFGLIDFWFISQLSDSVNSREDYVTAIGITFPIFFIIVAFSGGLSTAMSNLGSLYLGEDDHRKKNLFVATSIISSLVIWLFLVIFSSPIIAYSLNFFDISAGVHDLAYSYLSIIFYGSIFLFLFNILTQILSLYQDYKVQIGVAIASLLLAVLADYLFIFVFGLGIQGGAISTVLVFMISSLFLGMYIYKKEYVTYNFEFKRSYEIKNILEFKKFFIPAFVGQAFVMVEFFITNKIVSSFGETAIAGYSIGFKLQPIIFMIFLSFGITLMIMYGVFMGQKNIAKIKELEKYYIKIVIIASAFVGLGLLIFGGMFPTYFTTNPEIIAIASDYILMQVIFFVIFPFLFFQIAIFQITGSGKLRIAHTIVILTLITVLQYIGMNYSLGSVFRLYILGEFIGLLIFAYFTLNVRREKILSVK